MNKKKIISQILVFLIFFIIIIIAILIQNNNIYTETNSFEYANLNINQEELNIFYLDVGQGDSTFITINGYNMLIDSGNDQDGYYIVKFLKAQIGTLYMPNKENDTQTYERLLNAIERNNVNVDKN